jgi:HK97 family phage prohead protease
MDGYEARVLDDSISEVRFDDSQNVVYGYGIVFNSESNDLGGFTEIILPEAVQGVIEKSDIYSYLNHNKGRGVLARALNGIGSLRLSIDSKGVRYSFDIPKFDLGDEVREGIKRGDIKGSSFGFILAKNGAEIRRKKDGSILRIINKFFTITDMSPCYSGAYSDTTVALRSLEQFRNAEGGISLDAAANPAVGDEPATENLDQGVKTERPQGTHEADLKREHYKLKYNIKLIK